LQYAHWPIMSFLHRFMCPTRPIDEPSDLCLWVFVELRELFYSRGLVTEGDVIPAHDSVAFFDQDADDLGSAQLRWQVILRSDALAIIDG